MEEDLLTLVEEKEEVHSFLEKTISKDSGQQGALAGAVSVCSGIKDSAIIIHGSPGCGWSARWMRSDHILDNYVPIIATSILEDELIYGAGKKLKETIIWVGQNWRPKHLFIINGDTGSLINDPVSEIAAEFEKEYHVPIIVLDTPFFKGLEATGVDDALSSLIQRFTQWDIEKEKDAINLIAPFLMGSNNWVYDLPEMVRLLTALDLKINSILTYNTTIEDIKRFARAEANLYLTVEELSHLSEMEEKAGIKRLGLDCPLPFGIANTEEWLMGIAREFGREEKAKEVLKEERSHLKNLKYWYNASWLLTWLTGKSSAIIGPATWAASFANFLYFDLAIYPSVIALYAETDEALERAKGILSDLTNYYQPIILENPLYLQVGDALLSQKVDFSIGQTQEKAMVEGHGIPHLALSGLCSIFGSFNFIPYPYMGFRGVLYLLTLLAKLVEETFHETKKLRGLCFERRKD